MMTADALQPRSVEDVSLLSPEPWRHACTHRDILQDPLFLSLAWWEHPWPVARTIFALTPQLAVPGALSRQPGTYS